MKANRNNEKKKDYYLGLDVGTNSVGWAVTDPEYNLLKFHGKTMWGARLFSSAQDASGRRSAREARRRLDRRNQRLLILESLFSEEITKIDSNFFVRLHDSNLWPEDKHDSSCRYSLFCDKDFTDKDYLKQYPTIYHLRSELIHDDTPHDVRLVFLALHHLLKKRGHFLYANSENSSGKSLNEAMQDLKTYLAEYDISFEPKDEPEFLRVMQKDYGITVKKKLLRESFGDIKTEDDDVYSVSVLVDLLAGASVSLKKLFGDEELDQADVKSVCLKDDLDVKFDMLNEALGERVDLIFAAKEVFDIAQLGCVLGGNEYISDAKIELYDRNHDDLEILKKWVKKNIPGEYKTIFNDGENAQNFAAYSRYKTDNKCSQEDMCKFVLGKIGEMKKSSDPEEVRVYEKISDKTFYTKLKGTENGVIPYQVELKEVQRILENAAGYLSFLSESDEDGITVEEKIISTFRFRIPYYVGPLNLKSKNAWLSRTDEKIYPWNFSTVVDEYASAEGFMENLIGRCTYTGEPVLPADSLLYSEFTVLNALNSIKVNGNPITVDAKKAVYHDLFEKTGKKIRKKTIISYLVSRGWMEKSDELTGIDDTVTADLKSAHDFDRIINKTSDTEMVEKIIKSVLVFSDDKKMLKTWLKNNTSGLDKDDVNRILRMKYKDWGRLSKTFLTEIYTIDKNGEAYSIMDMLRNTNNNLMELLSNKYQFAENAQKYKDEHFNMADKSLRDRLDDLYIAPAVRRSIWQTLRIVDELVDIEKGAPSKIFIEMARTSSKEMQKKRTESRKNKLLELYKSCKEQEKELYSRLEQESDQSLRRDSLYLYYTQFGRCMYSGEPIDLGKLLKDDKTYDIDHIFPRSRIKDDSLNNRVLVKSKLNRDKTNTYPIDESTRTKMASFWAMLHDKKLISDLKYSRLTRNYPLTVEELSQFVARQLVETQQSTKALASMLNAIYPNTRIIYSKAGNVSEFRQKFELPKFREVNNFHHAKDAYLNIVVGNVYATKFTDQFFKNIRSENYSLKKVFDFNTEGAWSVNADKSISTVKKYMKKNNPIVTYAPYMQKGELFDLQIMPKGKGQLPVKTGMDIAKYGGYNKIAGSYFCIVEHTVKKKRMLTIVPVYVYCRELYEKNPIAYLTQTPGLGIGSDPKVVVKTLMINGLVELDGRRLMIVSRTGKSNVYLHTYEFAIDDKHAEYLKAASKYVDRCNVAKAILPVTKNDGISSEENIKKFDWFIERLGAPVYNALFATLQTQLIEGREKYAGLDMKKQCSLLLEVLKAFKCNAVYPNLDDLNGTKLVGRIVKSSNISSCKSVYLIHQSVTGLFEYKTDILR